MPLPAQAIGSAGGTRKPTPALDHPLPVLPQAILGPGFRTRCGVLLRPGTPLPGMVTTSVVPPLVYRPSVGARSPVSGAAVGRSRPGARTAVVAWSIAPRAAIVSRAPVSRTAIGASRRPGASTKADRDQHGGAKTNSGTRTHRLALPRECQRALSTACDTLNNAAGPGSDAPLEVVD